MAKFDAETKIWHGPKIDRSEDNSLTFRETLLKSFRSEPGKVFQISDDEKTETTFEELELMSIRVAHNLQKFGVEKNDVVAMMLKNSTYVGPIVFGCALIGAPINPLICRQGINVEWIKQTFDATKPKIIIMEEFVECSEMMMSTVKEMGLACKIFVVEKEQKSYGENIFNICELLMRTGEEKNFKLVLNVFFMFP